MIYKFIRPLLFKIDPELSHDAALFLLKLRFFFKKNTFSRRNKTPSLPCNVAGMSVPNPIGLAGGLDKNADYIDALFSLGFGFIEVGTITPKPQQGNPKPRLFRLPKALALINRMGFNNKGVKHLVHNLKTRKVPGVVGVNIGKNKDTPLELAHEDYCTCLSAVYPYADYITVNISSPNTPGLRELHGEAYLFQLLNRIDTQRNTLAEKHQRCIPMLIKISVDIPDNELPFIVATAKKCHFDGIISSNTTLSRESVQSLPHANQKGGLSGKPLRDRALKQAKTLREIAGNDFTIIGVGGIMNAVDAQNRLDNGADLIQIYSALIYEGPGLIKNILSSLKNASHTT